MVERHHALAFPGQTRGERIAFQQRAVVGVHRLGEAGHDVVGQIDDVVDGVQAERAEPELQPEGRGSDRDVVEDQSAEARAEIRVLAGYLDGGIACWQKR